MGFFILLIEFLAPKLRGLALDQSTLVVLYSGCNVIAGSLKVLLHFLAGCDIGYSCTHIVISHLDSIQEVLNLLGFYH